VTGTTPAVRIDHLALRTSDVESLERVRTFYETYFGAQAGGRYASTRRPGFVSCLLAFPGEPSARIELMTAAGLTAAPPGEVMGYAHAAIGRDVPASRDGGFLGLESRS